MKKLITSIFAASLLLAATSAFAAQPACVADLQANRPGQNATDAERQAYRDAWRACMQQMQNSGGNGGGNGGGNHRR